MLFPAFAASLKTSSQNTTLATAAQLVSQQIDEARSRTATCAALQTYQGETIAPVVDSRNVSLQPKRSSVTCPASYPGVVTINVTVSVTGSASTLATATTYIMVMSSS
jgi:type II secretory pathway pseudopilin PulG